MINVDMHEVRTRTNCITYEEELEMVISEKERKNNYQVNGRLILGLLVVLGFFTIIVLTTMLSTSDNIVKNNKIENVQSGSIPAQVEETKNDSLLAVVRTIDTENKQVTLYDIFGQNEVVLNYTGGTNITDEYGQIIAISQIVVGSMVDVTYTKNSNKVSDMSISSKAWKYVGVNNFTLNHSSHIMRIAKKQYKLTDGITILDGRELISLNDIAEQDILTIWGNEETIWSITVTRGHGFVILQDYQDFLGDNLTVGHEAMQQITNDMMITVREGDYNLTVENGEFSATKRIRINRNDITYVSLKDLGPGAPRHGRVLFEISPFGADLYIKGELISYADEIELLYGRYPIKVSLGGYVAYEGELIVDSPGKTIKVNLPESWSNQEAEISETNTQGNTKDNAQNNTKDNKQDNTNNNSPQDSTHLGGTQEQDEELSDTQQDLDQTSDNEDIKVPIGEADNADDDIIDTKHQIHIQNPIGASVYFDGEYMGTSPVSFKKIIGSHVITFIEEGHETMSYSIEVLNDGTDAYFTFPKLISKSTNNKN